MKFIKPILVCFGVLCLYACVNKPYPHTMQIADTLVYSDPASAIVLLEQLEDSIASEPKEIQNYYWLLWIKANDKAYITHSSDSLIQEVLQYYENKGDSKHLPEAYYYAGRVYSDLGDAPQALDYFQKAAEMLEGSTDYRLLRVVYSQMGELFLFQGVYEEAMKVFKKSYQRHICIKDERSKINDLNNIGVAFTAMGNADSALYYYQKAYKHAEKIGEKGLIDKVKRSLIDLYTQLEQYDLAKSTLGSLESLLPQDQIAFYSTAADLYYQTEKLDSATHYYNKLLQYDNIYAQQIAHWGLAVIAQKKHDYQSILNHISQYNECTDSIQKITDSESIRKMQSFYNYQLREKENNQLRLKNAQQEQLIIYFIIAVILTIAISIAHMQYNKREKLQLATQLDKLNQIKEKQYRNSSQFIEENNRKIAELESALEQNKESSDEMKQLFSAQKEQIILLNNQVEVAQKEQSLAQKALRQSKIYNKFHDAVNGNGTIDSKDWKILCTVVDHYYKDFTSRLRTIYPVSDIEKKICLLLKIEISVTGIALLTGRSKSAIVSARKKLYEKTHGEKGKPEQWDVFIQKL